MIEHGTFTEDCLRIHRQFPLVHNITNYVAMNLSANALLAIGASALMSSEPEEMSEIVTTCDALQINLGCLEKRQVEAMVVAARTANALGKPWVLDPVGVGISRLRTETTRMLIARYNPVVIRGNASEIMFLAGADAIPRGVDATTESHLAVEHAVRLAKETGAVVSVSGLVDYITDGTEIFSIFNGSPMMSQVSAMGCTASAITAAFLAVDDIPLYAATNAMALMGIAGERAAAESAGPGSLVANFIDLLAGLDPEEAANSIRYEQISA